MNHIKADLVATDKKCEDQCASVEARFKKLKSDLLKDTYDLRGHITIQESPDYVPPPPDQGTSDVCAKSSVQSMVQELLSDNFFKNIIYIHHAFN